MIVKIHTSNCQLPFRRRRFSFMKKSCVYARKKPSEKIVRPNGGYEATVCGRESERNLDLKWPDGEDVNRMCSILVSNSLLFECRKKDDACLKRSAETSVTCEVWPARFWCCGLVQQILWTFSAHSVVKQISELGSAMFENGNRFWPKQNVCKLAPAEHRPQKKSAISDEIHSWNPRPGL